MLILIPKKKKYFYRCGESGDRAHTISYCPKRLKSIKRESEDHEEEDPRIPTPMIGPE